MTVSSSGLRIRLVPATGAAVAATVILVGIGPTTAAHAGTFTRESFSFSDPFAGSFQCDGFSASFAGQDHGFVTTWFDANGDPVRQEGHIEAVETDTNDATGASVEVRTRLNVHVDYAADTQSITGIRNLSNQPGAGVVIQSVGRLVVAPSDGQLISVHGPADDVFLGGGFCEALSP
ncbi:MAG: hypothetical protein QOJ11_3419 [Frankiales bacterium]|jgi:hypothetical protein|nr:hypothetical protein [Frankiales bacterium]